MKKIKAGFVILWGIGLLILFLAASTNLIIDDRAVKVYRISVIWDCAAEDYVEDYKKNMERYGNIKNIEYHYCSLTPPFEASQQARLIRQEEEAGADLVVVKPTDDQKLDQALEEEKIYVPVVCIDGMPKSNKVCINIRTDEEQRAKDLTEVIREEGLGDIVWVLDDGKNEAQNKRYLKGMEQSGKELGLEIKCFPYKGQEELRKKLEQEEGVFVALNPESTEMAAEFLDQAGKGQSGLYGFGYTKKVLGLMEKGRVRAISVSSNFSMGWMAIQHGFKILDGEHYEREQILPGETVKAEEMFDPRFEDILFAMD